MFKISTEEKKNITEIETWKNDSGETIIRSIGWRWGTWLTTVEPNLEDYDEEEGCDIDDLAEDIELESTDDGCWEEFEYPESWDDDKIAEFEVLWEDEGIDAFYSAGFDNSNTIMMVRGPLNVEEIEDDG